MNGPCSLRAQNGARGDGMTQQEVPGAQPLFALELNIPQQESPFSSRDEYPVAVGVEDFPRLAGSAPAEDGGKDLQFSSDPLLVGKPCERGWPRVHRPDFAIQFDPAGIPVQFTVLAAQFPRVGGQRGILLLAGRGSVLE